MSKKNSQKIRDAHHAYAIREETRRAEEAAKRQKKRDEKKYLAAAEKDKSTRLTKKPKVAPVVAAQSKLLGKQLKAMSLGASKKIDMADSSDDSSDDQELTHKRPISRASHQMLKKAIRRRKKTGTNAGKKGAKRLKNKYDELKREGACLREGHEAMMM